MSQYLNPNILFLLFNIFQPTRQLFDELKKFVSLISLLI